MGAMGASLATMVANLSSHKRGWDDRWEEFSDWAERGKAFHGRLLELIDLDTRAFMELMAAFGLPKASDEEKVTRTAAIQAATKGAIQVPLEVMQVSLDAMSVIRKMAEIGNPNSASDAGVGALAARAAVRGAYLNIKTNCASVKDEGFRASTLAMAAEIELKAADLEAEILAIVEGKL